MSAVVILGMHRSGTSLVANILHHVGVSMGTNFLAADRNNSKGYYEDTDFLWINKGLLEAAGGSWDNPPEREDMYRVRGKFMKNLVKTIARKEKAAGAGMWGWKDPRTCLTIDLFYPWLSYPRIIRVTRNRADIIDSLYRTGVNGAVNAIDLCQRYEGRINDFINRTSPDCIEVSYGRLSSYKFAGGELMKLGKFLGIPARKFHDVYNLIEFKK